MKRVLRDKWGYKKQLNLIRKERLFINCHESSLAMITQPKLRMKNDERTTTNSYIIPIANNDRDL
jgi:hypothetical protein